MDKTDFLKHLRSEKLKAQEARTTYTLKKLTYATTLLGLGSLNIDVEQITAIGPINLGYLLYLTPLVALAFDLYVLAEDYSVKRFGAFLGENSPDVLERGWENWVSQNRDPFAPFAMPVLTTLLLIGAAIIMWIGGSAEGPIFWGWLIFTALVTWTLYVVYWRLRRRVRQNVKSIIETGVTDADG